MVATCSDVLFFSEPVGIALSTGFQLFVWNVDRNLFPIEIPISIALSPMIVFPVFYLIETSAQLDAKTFSSF
jgi:hypothetical protein